MLGRPGGIWHSLLRSDSTNRKALRTILPLTIIPLLLFGFITEQVVRRAFLEQIDEQREALMRNLSGLAISMYRLEQDSLLSDVAAFRELLQQRGKAEIAGGRMVLRSDPGSFPVDADQRFVDQFDAAVDSEVSIHQVLGDNVIGLATATGAPRRLRSVGERIPAPVYDAVVKRGESYLGLADVAGITHLAAYEGMLDRSGRVIAMLGLEVSRRILLERMLPVLAAADFGDSGRLQLVDRSGNRIADSSGNQAADLLSSELLQTLHATRERALRQPLRAAGGAGVAGPELWYSFVPELDVFLVAQIYREEASALLTGLQRALFYLWLPCLALALALAMRLYRVVSGLSLTVHARDRALRGSRERLQTAEQALRRQEEQREEQRRQLEQQGEQLRNDYVKARDKLEAIAASTNAGILALDGTGALEYLSPRFTELFGYDASDMTDGQSWSQRAGANDQSKRLLALLFDADWNRLRSHQPLPVNLEVTIRTKAGLLRNALLTKKRSENSVVVTLSDISEQKRRQETIKFLSQHDALTGLPSRNMLSERLDWSVKQTKRSRWQLGVAFLDLDGFKGINDTHGHDVGDMVLKEVAARLKAAVREVDIVARLGGDEFVIALTEIEKREDSLPLFQRILDVVGTPITVDEVRLQVTCSLGISFYSPENEVDGDQLLRQADKAMYDAKLAGKNRFSLFDHADKQLRGETLRMLDDIAVALRDSEFVLYYQPKVDLRTGEVLGAEALLRWVRATGEVVAPGAFLPLIHDHHLAEDIGTWVLEQVLADLNGLLRKGLDLSISINVFPRQVLAAQFIPQLQRSLDKHPTVSPDLLEFEIVETAAINDLEATRRAMQKCKQLGIRFALDDFGTGFSSLTHLKHLPVSTLKIDKSFVADMLSDNDDLAIVESTVSLAKAFGHTVIAEGVSSPELGRRLLQLGCSQVQGFAIARPMPLDSLVDWIADWKLPAQWRSDRLGAGDAQATPSPSVIPAHKD